MRPAVSVAELCRKHGVSDASIYKWKAKLGGMGISARKVREPLDKTLSDQWLQNFYDTGSLEADDIGKFDQIILPVAICDDIHHFPDLRCGSLHT
jgi:Transposase